MRFALAPLFLLAAPAAAQDAPAVPDAELARMTGRFVLSNGAELAVSIVSDAAVDGRAVLRSVLTVDRGTDLKVFARAEGSEPGVGVRAGVAAAATGANNGVVIDRGAGGLRVQSVAAPAAPAVGVSAGGGADPAAAAAAMGLTEVRPTAGGAAVATADGALTLRQLPNGAAVGLAGDRFGVLQVLGGSVVSAAVNSASDRVLDTVTEVQVTLRDVTPFTTGSAMMRADALALDAAARMVR